MAKSTSTLPFLKLLANLKYFFDDFGTIQQRTTLQSHAQKHKRTRLNYSPLYWLSYTRQNLRLPMSTRDEIEHHSKLEPKNRHLQILKTSTNSTGPPSGLSSLSTFLDVEKGLPRYTRKDEMKSTMNTGKQFKIANLKTDGNTQI